MISIKSKIGRIAYMLVASIIVVSVVWSNAWRVTALMDIPSGTILNKLIRDLIVFVFVLFFTGLVIKPKEIFSFLGLDSNILKGFGVALICVIPIYIGFSIFGSFNPDVTLYALLKKCILAGIKEELVFRAFMFGLLFRYAKIGFFWALIIPSLYFGSLHLYQGHDLLSTLAAFGVTFLGAIYFSWLYVEWNFNLWLPIFLHILMNGAWVFFTMTGTEVAAGGLLSNIFRIVSIIVAVGITIWYKKKSHTPLFSYPVWAF